MAQLTLYLDDATQQLMEEAISASGLSRSRWVAELIREKLAQQWPEEVLAQFGRFEDFPLREELELAELPPDVDRVGF